MPQDFVIFCRARTGSYSLVSRLESCADITCHGEIFKKTALEIPKSHRRRLSFKIPERNARPLDYIAALRALDASDHVGFKIFPPHLQWAPGAIVHLTARETRKIVLHRDPLETYASTLRMRQTGLWKLKEGETPPPEALAAKVSFSKKSFERFHRNYTQFIAMCHLIAGLPNSFVLDYRQINDPRALDALLGFLGSSARAAESSTEYRKQYSGRLEDSFTNWKDLAGHVRKRALLAGPAPTHPLA